MEKRAIQEKILRKLMSIKPPKWGNSHTEEDNLVKGLPSHLRGAKIVAYDPKAREEAETHYLKDNNKVSYVDSKYDALKSADAVILVTEWQEFRSPDFDEMKKLLKNSIFFDGRNQFDKEKMNEYGFEYFQIGVN